MELLAEKCVVKNTAAKRTPKEFSSNIFYPAFFCQLFSHFIESRHHGLLDTEALSNPAFRSLRRQLNREWTRMLANNCWGRMAAIRRGLGRDKICRVAAVRWIVNLFTTRSLMIHPAGTAAFRYLFSNLNDST